MRNKHHMLLGLALISTYLLSRSLFLTKLPIFTDEAIYIRWGQIALQDAAHRFISLQDGKQPLFIWLMLPALHLIKDPLVAGRIISVIAGLVSLVGITALSWRLLGEKIAWLAGLLYIITPFFVLYDRLALYDSLTTATMIWSLFLAVLLSQTLRLDVALLLGMAIGIGLLTKSSAIFALLLLPTTLLLFNWKKSSRLRRLISWSLLALSSSLLALLFQTLLRLSPLYHMIGLKNLNFIYSFQEFLKEPFISFFGNLRGLTEWGTIYLTIPIVTALVIGIIAGLKKHQKETLVLLIWFAFPFLALAMFGKVLYPRFILFMVTPLLLLAALGISQSTQWLKSMIKKETLLLPSSTFFYLLLLGYPIFFSSQIIFKPIDAPLPLVDRNQLLDDWPSGYGITEAVALLREKGRQQQIFVGTEGTFGLTPAALEIYLKDEKNIQIKGYWPISLGMDELIEISETGKPTYVLFKDTQKPLPEWPLTEIARYRKGKGNVFMSLYRVTVSEN